MNLDEKLNMLIEEYKNQTEFTAEVTFKTREEGGRHTGIRLDKYKPYIYTKHGYCRAQFCKIDDEDIIMPGDTGTVKLVLDKPLKLQSGDSFAVYDSKINNNERNKNYKTSYGKEIIVKDTGERKPGYEYAELDNGTVIIVPEPKRVNKPVAEGKIK